MKSSMLHRKILRNKWKLIKAEGSHYIYEKDQHRYPVPYHGSKEIGMGILHKIVKEMKLK
jgi:predicted RNA binding protein YcfA (HicA-like mRNA interferase family)